MNNNDKKYQCLIRICWITLFAIWLVCLINGKYLHIVVENEKVIEIGKYVDDHWWILYPLKFIMYYIEIIFIYYTILNKKIFSYKPILLSSIIAIFWVIKTKFVNYDIVNYIDFITFGILIFFIPKKWYKVIVGTIMVFTFTIISSITKSLFISNYEQSILPSIIMIFYSIDIYLMVLLYYLYKRKGKDIYMKVIKELIEHMDDTLEEVETYYDEYCLLKEDDPMLASSYLEIGNLHLQIYDKLHSRVVEIINKYKNEKGDAPSSMKAIWDYEHEKLVDEYNELKYKYANAR